MITLHTAIRNLYPNVTSVLEDSAGNFTCKDKDGNVVSIDKAAVNTEYEKIQQTLPELRIQESKIASELQKNTPPQVG